MKVRAKRLGYYGHRRIKEGEVFTLFPVKYFESDERADDFGKEKVLSPKDQFSEKWMEEVKEKAPVEYEVVPSESSIADDSDFGDSEDVI